MVANYKTPGVYLEEIFPTPAPELFTGVPAFLGITEAKNIPVNTPQMLTLWPQFEQYFGLPLGQRSYLAYAVRGFFENGGRLCYVIRLEDSTKAALEKGLEALAALDSIDLVCVPDIMLLPTQQVLAMQKAVLEHCEQMGDRFAILDALNVAAINKDEQIQEIQKQGGQLISDKGALYCPWVKVKPIQDQNDSKLDLLSVPPSGHIAGVYSRSDRAAGVHQSPANYLLEGVLDLTFNFSNADQELLNPTVLGAGVIPNLSPQAGSLGLYNQSPPTRTIEKGGIQNGFGVNCLRVLRGRGIRIWGASTLSADPNWHYISVRRLFITIHRWVQLNLADVAFEPNDFKLWVRIERELSVYLESLVQQGALQGNTPQEAFYIKCNAETNPPEVRDAGMVVTEIGLAPTIPNEFIIVRLIHGTSGVSLTP